MPFIPVENVALAELRMTQDLQEVENTLYFRLAGGWDADSLATLGADLLAWWEGNIRPLTWIGVQLREVVCTDLTSDTAPSITSTPSGTLTGELDEEALPNNVSVAVSFRTAGRGRSSRGRNFFVGVTDSNVTGNQIVSGFIADLKFAYEQIGFGGSFTDDSIWSVVSRFHDNAPRVTGVSVPVTSVTIVDNTVDSQRRRLPGRGR